MTERSQLSTAIYGIDTMVDTEDERDQLHDRIRYLDRKLSRAKASHTLAIEAITEKLLKVTEERDRFFEMKQRTAGEHATERNRRQDLAYAVRSFLASHANDGPMFPAIVLDKLRIALKDG